MKSFDRTDEKVKTGMRYKLACFDLDGTLLDTLGGLTQSLNAARRMNNLEPQTEEQVRSFIGNGVTKLIERTEAEASEG